MIIDVKKYRNAYKLFKWAVKNPKASEPATLDALGEMFLAAIKAAEENRPYMTKVGTVNLKDEVNPIVTIWAGPGEGCNPTDRIAELVADNDELLAENAVLKKKLGRK